MSASGVEPPWAADLADRMRRVADKALEVSGDLRILFVTNLKSGEVLDVGPTGLLNVAQYYTRAEADEIIRSLQSLGANVEVFFSELDFIRHATQERRTGDGHTVVFTTAEGGSGSGRRALIPALCNLLGLPVVNSGAHACSLARHKFHANAVLARVGVRVPVSWLYGSGGWLGGSRPPAGARVIMKPTYESMCIGVDADSVQLVDGRFEQLVAARTSAYGQPVVVQEFISGEEVGVPVARIGVTYALPPISFRKANGDPFGSEARTFEVENILHDTSRVPFEAPPAQYEAVQHAAVAAFDALEMRGVGRIDMRFDADGRAWVFDTNESPPPLASTAYSTAMEALGFTVEEMLAVWLGICLLDHRVISGV